MRGSFPGFFNHIYRKHGYDLPDRYTNGRSYNNRGGDLKGALTAWPPDGHGIPQDPGIRCCKKGNGVSAEVPHGLCILIKVADKIGIVR